MSLALTRRLQLNVIFLFINPKLLFKLAFFLFDFLLLIIFVLLDD
jgi:hypothetical protein